MYIYIYLPKTKKFGCVGRGDLTSLFYMYIYIDNFCVEVFEKTKSRTYVIDHSFERKFKGVCFRLS